jgi:hypothetical protein
MQKTIRIDRGKWPYYGVAFGLLIMVIRNEMFNPRVTMFTIFAKGGAPSGQSWPKSTTILSTRRMRIKVLLAVGMV